MTYFELLDLVVGRLRVVGQHLERHPLLGHRPHRLLVHLSIVDAHTAEDGKGLKQEPQKLNNCM